MTSVARTVPPFKLSTSKFLSSFNSDFRKNLETKKMIENICKHNKFGFCKFGDKCQFRHINDLCLIKNCNVGACENRHPKFCYYQKNYGRCKFTTFCKYSHEKENQVIEINGNSCDFRQRLEEKESQIANLDREPINFVRKRSK